MNPQELADIMAAKSGDRDAVSRLIDRHKGLMVKMCEGIFLPGYEFDDLYQDACIALMSAVRWWKPDRGWLFSTYLGQCVRNKLGEHIKKNKPIDGGMDADWYADEDNTAVGMLEEVLPSLCPTERIVLSIRFGLAGGGEQSWEKVGKRLSISAGTAEKIGVQAMGRVKDCLFVAA